MEEGYFPCFIVYVFKTWIFSDLIAVRPLNIMALVDEESKFPKVNPRVDKK